MVERWVEKQETDCPFDHKKTASGERDLSNQDDQKVLAQRMKNRALRKVRAMRDRVLASRNTPRYNETQF